MNPLNSNLIPALVSALMALSPILAHATPEPASAASLNRMQKRYAAQTILCARDLAQAVSTDSGFPGRYVAIEILTRTALDLQSESALQGLADECQGVRKALRSGDLRTQDPSYTKLRAKFADWIALGEARVLENAPRGVATLMAAFNDIGSVECRMVGPQVAAGLGVVLLADVEVGLCKRGDLRRWIAVGTSLGLGVGAVNAVSLRIEDDSLGGDKAFDLEEQNEIGFFGGIGGSVSMIDGLRNPEGIAIGVGAGVYIGRKHHSVARVIPVRSDVRALVEMLRE